MIKELKMNVSIEYKNIIKNFDIDEEYYDIVDEFKKEFNEIDENELSISGYDGDDELEIITPIANVKSVLELYHRYYKLSNN
jgi:hypothetical protein